MNSIVERYYCWVEGYVSSYQIGRMDGYESIDDLKKDLKRILDDIKKKRGTYWITKSIVVETNER
ncbi:MAG: hypothetical protein N2V78_09495 [Methanophagales archaeon]|nr:hypothetical protein [Methanophagales archaeon]